MRKLLLIISILFCSGLVAQNRFIDSFAVYNTPTNRNSVLSTYVNKDSYKFMTGKDMFNGWLYMYMATQDTLYGNFCKRFIDSVRSSAQISNTIADNIYPYQDGFYGWTSKSSSTVGSEVPLYESYITDVIFEFFYFHSLWSDDTDWLNDNIQWFTDNLWTKWKLRSRRTYGAGNPYRFFLRSRTHDGAHWAIVASILTKIGLADSIKTQAAEVVSQYDILLQRNLQDHPTIPDAYFWNGSYDDVTGTQANAAPATPAHDDVSHANHTVRYMYFAELLGNPLYTYSKNKKVANLAKGLYNGDGTFWDLFDEEVDPNRDNNWGSYHGDGWMLYSKYDTALYNIYVDRLDNYNSITKGYNQTYEYSAQLALAYYTLNNLPDTVRRDTTNNIGVLAFRKTIAVPDPTVTPEELDNVKAVLSNGTKYRIIRLGENQSSYFGIYPDDNAADMIQAAYNRTDVKSILLSDDTISVYDVGKLNAGGGVLRFANGAKITSADTISNLVVDANTNAEIISGSPVFVNLKANGNKFYAAWVGVKGDGGNYTSRLNYAIEVAAANGLELILPEGTIYADNYVYLRNYLRMQGDNTLIQFKQGSGIKEFSNAIHDIKLSNLTIKIVDTTTGSGVPAISIDGATYNIKNIDLKNVSIDASGKADATIRIDNADSVAVENVILTNSNSEGLYATNVKRLSVKNSTITRSGTSAIVATTVKDMRVNNVYVKGISILRTSGSSYGISITSDSTGNEITNSTVIVDSSSNSGTDNYPFKLASPGIVLMGSKIVAAGQQTTYAVRTDAASSILIKDVDIDVADKAPARLLYLDNVKKVLIDKLNVNVNDNATGSTMKLLYATGDVIDSIQFIVLKNVTLNNFTKSDYLFDIRKRTSFLSVDGLNIDSIGSGRVITNTDSIVHFSLNNLNIKSSRSGAIMSIPATVKSFLHTSSSYIKGDTTIASVNGSVSSKQESIYVNGHLLWEASTSGGVGSIDTTSVIATKYDLSAYALAVRTLSAGWGLQGGGNLSANRSFNVDSSLLATRARLKHVTDSILALFNGYDTLSGNFVQDGDSLILNLGSQRFAVFNQSSGGGGGSPAGSTGDLQMNNSGSFAVATGLSRTGTGFNVATRMNLTGRGYVDSVFTVRKNGLAASQLSSTFGLHVSNETLATSGVPVQISPVYGMRGSAWNTTSSAANDVFFNEYLVPVSGSSVTAYKLFRAQIAGGSQAEIGRWYNNGNFQAEGTLGAGSVPSGTAGTHPLVVLDGETLKQIPATYYAADNAVVKLTTNQTLAGIKTFSSIPVLPASSPTTDNQAVRKKYVDDLIAALNLESGVYTPTLASTTNIASNTVLDLMYERFGNNVNVRGIIRVTPSTGSGLTGFEIPLLFSPNFTSVDDVRGTFKMSGGLLTTVKMSANTSSENAVVSFTATSTDEITINVDFGYTIIQP